MARARNIKPALFKNEVLGIADPLLTLLFEGLWVLADREGRLENRPLRIKAEIFPYRDRIKVDEMLTWLDSNGFITLYEFSGQKLIQINNFAKHQNPHKNESESIIPAPDSIGISTDKIGIDTDISGIARADSLNLIPDSLNLIPDTSESDDFAPFWSLYPRKTNKEKAKTAWRNMSKSARSKAIEVLPNHCKQMNWLKDGGQFIPHASTWLNGKRFEDDLRTSPSGHNLSNKVYEVSEDGRF